MKSKPLLFRQSGNSAFLLATLPFLAFSACSLKAAPGNAFVSFEPSQLRLPRRSPRLGVFPDYRNVGRFEALSLLGPGSSEFLSTPTGIGGFNCFAVNVTAQEIPPSGVDPSVSVEGDPDCTYPGITSTLYPASSNGGEFSMSIPTGSDRTVQVIGVQTAQSCPTGLLADNVSNPAITGIYELGRAVSDIYSSTSLTIKSSFAPSEPKAPFTCHNYKYFAYVLNNDTDGSLTSTIDVYSVDLGTGKMTSVQNGVPAGTDSRQLVVDPGGRFVYVANLNAGTGNIAGFSIAATSGELTALPGSPYPVGAATGTDTVAIDPYGAFVYSGDSQANTLTVFSVSPATGALTKVGTQASGVSPSGVVVDPTGNFVYSANYGSGASDGSVNAMKIAADGTLSPVGTNPLLYDGGVDYPVFLSVDPTGYFVFIANGAPGSSNHGGVSSFEIQNDGSLNLVGAADTGYQYAATVANPYMSGVVYGGEGAVEGGIETFNFDVDTGQISTAGYTAPPTAVDASAGYINQINIDPLGYYLFAVREDGTIETYPILSDGYASPDGAQVFKESPNFHPNSIAIARVQQP